MLYDTTLNDILDKHAPKATRTFVLRPKAPWLTDSILEEKRKKRKADIFWMKSKTDKDWKAFKSIRNSYSFSLYEARKSHHIDLVSEHKENTKALFNIIKGLLNMSNKQPIVPRNVDSKSFVNNLGKFFLDKVQKIHNDIDLKLNNVHVDKPINDDVPVNLQIVTLTSFKSLSEQDVRKLIMKLSKKSCPLDPMPTQLLLQCLDELIPVITSMLNLSLSAGQFPALWKVALVKPLLKKPGLETELSNLRPISNLQYISKLVEGAATQQILEHIEHHSLLPFNQSAYRKFHSTETALLRIKSDLLMSMDNQKISLLLLLDMSRAFDTIDHSCLLKTLRSHFRVDGKVIEWIESYLSDRKQKIEIDNVVSDVFNVPFGVPQGSRLGPLLFTLYTSRLLTNIHTEFPSISCHCYADDTQLYLSFCPITPAEDHCISELESCVVYIKIWMLQNKLMLNNNKTELLVIGTPRQVSKFRSRSVSVGDSTITPSDTV